MISRNLARRLEQLETQLIPAAVEPGPILTIHFVAAADEVDGIEASPNDRHVVDTMEIQLAGIPRSRKKRRW
ncbi:MAG: hypothetical protein WCB12_05845 [Bryobacteraceae bacterium]